MTDQLLLVRSEIKDPFINLALECELFEQLRPNQRILFLWENSPCVVIGRFQNPWIECDLNYMKQHKIPLVRRISGGGCVYHDLGNLNFSFMVKQDLLNKTENLNIILEALSSFNIVGQINPRFDLVLNSKKFSGSSYRFSKGKGMHHGTLLIKANKKHLRQCLRSPGYFIKSKATASVRSHTINLIEKAPGVTSSLVIEEVTKTYLKHYQDQQTNIVRSNYDESLINSNPAILERVTEFKSTQWIYNSTPDFTHEIPLNSGQNIALQVKKGRVNKIIPLTSSPETYDINVLNKFQGNDYHGLNLAEIMSIF